jgi:hypothetical protein
MSDERFNSGRTRGARRESRAARLGAKSDRLLKESGDAGKRAKRYLPDPPDQPILIGHHSEKRHRNALKKWDAAMRKAIDLWREAKEAERRARSASTNAAIRTTDADAVELLTLRKAELQSSREWMKAVNEAWRANGRPRPLDHEGWARIALSMEEPSESFIEIRGRMAGHWREDAPPFDSMSLQNIGANIRRVAERIEDVEKAQTTPARPERRIGQCVVRDNPDYDAVELHFRGKPAADVIALLKAHGFRWVRTAGCWSRRGRNATTEWKLGLIANAIGAAIETVTDIPVASD